MQTIFSTADVPRAKAFDYWLATSRATLQRCDLEAISDPREWYAEMQVGMLGDLTLANWQAGSVISRCSGDERGDLLLFLPSSRCAVEFPGGYSFEHNRHNLFLNDTSQPLIGYSLEPTARMVVRIPREVLARRMRITRNVVNRPVALSRPGAPGNVADTTLLNAFVRDLVRVG
ncbi:MAG: hypothetical protein FWD50_07005, partial [Betaproteobacteria bacterium]|nr:hypothetical protein [Betaproteobacteria bacterium]